MITIEVLVSQTAGLSRDELDRWIRNEWVKPESVDDTIGFDELDIARVILIRDLRDDLEVNDAALPVVLSLIDQLYDLRRQVRLLGEVMRETVPAELRTRLLQDIAARKP